MRFIFLFILGLLGTQSLVQAYPLLQRRSGNIIRRTSPEPSSTHLPDHERLVVLKRRLYNLHAQYFELQEKLPVPQELGAHTKMMNTIGDHLDRGRLDQASLLLDKVEDEVRRKLDPLASAHLPDHERLEVLTAKWVHLAKKTSPIIVELRKQEVQGPESSEMHLYTSAMNAIGKLLESENPQVNKVSKLLDEAERSFSLLQQHSLGTFVSPHYRSHLYPSSGGSEGRGTPASPPRHLVSPSGSPPRGSKRRRTSSPTGEYDLSSLGSSHQGGPSPARLSNAHRPPTVPSHLRPGSHPPGMAPASPSHQKRRRADTSTPGYAGLDRGPSQLHRPNAHHRSSDSSSPYAGPHDSSYPLLPQSYAPPGLNPSSLSPPPGPSSLYMGPLGLSHRAPQSDEHPPGNPLQHFDGSSFRDLLGPPIDFGSLSSPLQSRPDDLHPSPPQP